MEALIWETAEELDKKFGTASAQNTKTPQDFPAEAG